MKDNRDTALKPPASWEFGTRAVMAAIGAAGGFAVLLFACDLALRHYLSTGDPAVSPLLIWVVENPTDIQLLHFLLLGAYLGGFYLWRHRTREMLVYFVPADTATPVRHWSIPVWSASVFAAFLIRLNDPGAGSDALFALQVDAIQEAVRIGGITVLLFGVWTIRDQVRQAIVDSRAPRPPAHPPIVAAEFTEGVADDGWWWQVRETVHEQDLVMLVSTGEAEHRWLFVPKGGDPAAVRATVPAGATITAFPEPPAGGGTEEWTAPEAEEFHGLIKEAGSGELRYRRVSPDEVPEFLAEARSALRWALYPTDTPDSVVAVAPSV
ncbi:hypothetical protein [Actinoplanes sp. NPDC051851]|uniref:hypothetical protein n=1 Tax=Actinoplanes sp. NPDC051851 TaxID=3154753 RepID=UPI003438BF05